ncbi:TlpA family protein disulfide reductase [Aureitalea marina]|uniref:Thioredoxin domain-containing protein n=1 Tax=Aureitalea marina TaxID=930804 RepID=A0A2S7KSX8_9FLAO|nr:TlpA disulfide reductase family protein [Aureitalea marina]PQB05730.1 hypothetical protein BST85_13100 [Aureitalea marina]
MQGIAGLTIEFQRLISNKTVVIMLTNVLKTSLFIFLLSTLILGCEEERENPFSVLEVNIANQQFLDSLIIYDKDESWEVKSIIRFTESNSVIDTLNILQTKRYQIYSFISGNQGEMGELLISPNSKISLSIDENQLFESISYSGNFKLPNNFLAYSKKHQNQLSEMVRNGIEQEDLEISIDERSKLIHEKGKALDIVDSLSTYVDRKFNKFAEILIQKNIKHQYKQSLIGEIGNNFFFKDVNNREKSLRDFKGKYIYIDVWATWCKPCKVEHTYLEQLDDYFSDNDDFQIISVSTDSEFDKWKRYVTKNSMEGIQLYSGADSDFVKFYDIGALPRFILLDQAGRIINSEEIRPSNPELLKKLNSTVHNDKYAK